MDFENQELETSFSVPDEPTVRQRLRYDSAVELFGEFDLYERLWNGVRALGGDWESPHVQLDQDMNDAASDDAINVIKWAGIVLFSHMQAEKEIPKN